MLASRGGIAGETLVLEDVSKSKFRGKIINVASLVSYQGQRHIFPENHGLMIERRRCNCPRIRSCQTWSHRVGEATLLDCGLANAEGADNTARQKLFQTNGARKALTLTGMSLLSYLNLNRYKVLYFVSELLRGTSLQRLPFYFTYEGRIFLSDILSLLDELCIDCESNPLTSNNGADSRRKMGYPRGF